MPLYFIWVWLQESEKKDKGAKKMKTIKVGIWGGHGGSGWDDGSYSGIREITLKYDQCIDSIQVLYSDKAGNPVISQKHGGTGGNKTSQVRSQLIVRVIIYFLDIELTKNRIDMN